MYKKLVLVDGSGFIFRAFHALPPLKRPDGTPVGAVYGFCNMLHRLLETAKQDEDSEAIAIIFDAGRQTFRQQIYAEYKAHRPETPEELIPQFSIIREACTAFHLPTIELEGFEADDLIASYTKEALKQGCQVTIVSSDKDLMQLVQPGVTLYDPLKNKMMGEEAVMEKFGVAPDRVIDVQALAGDSSDNVPGVPGIGIKTAADLIRTFGSLEDLLAQAGTIKQPKRRQSILENVDKARISYELVKLCDTAPLPAPLSDLGIKDASPIVLADFLRFQGFNSLVARITKNMAPAPQETPIKMVPKHYQTIRTREALAAFCKECEQAAVLSVDSETTSLNARAAELVGLSLSLAEGTGVYIPINHQEATPQVSLDDVKELVGPLLTNPAILKVGHNLKYDLVVLKKYDLAIAPLSDTMLMSYVLDGAKHGHSMDELAQRHLHYQTITYTDVAGSGRTQKRFDEVAIEMATPYAAEDADITLRLFHFFKKRLAAEKMMSIYEQIERPLVQVIADMEYEGIKVDLFLLQRLEHEFSSQMQALETEVHGLAPRPFNIASPKQLGEILFDELKLPAPKKTKTGAYVTDADVLEKLADEGHLLPAKVLEWRALAKLKSTYVDGLTAAINHKTQRVHTSYSLAATSTGRLASSDPNLQNIPIRTENGRRIRQAFVARPGYKLVSLDYSQIELRLLAHMASVPHLTQAFLSGVDIHAATASQMFGIPIEGMDPAMRRRAKAINFGIIYGISAFGLSKQLSISRTEAGDYIKAYFQQYPGIQDYMEQCKKQARENGYVVTLFGRRCFTPGILDKNPMMQQFAERQAINAPLQGSNADIIKKAMIKIPGALAQAGSNAKMLLQVHDELVFEVPQEELETTPALLKDLMQSIVTLKVPLIVGVGVGNNWDEAH